MGLKCHRHDRFIENDQQISKEVPSERHMLRPKKRQKLLIMTNLWSFEKIKTTSTKKIPEQCPGIFVNNKTIIIEQPDI
jgi:hypothetical protein